MNPLIYVQISIVSFFVNVIPAFVPPTWLLLGVYKVNHAELNIVLLAAVGVLGSALGRYVMYKYSKFFSKYVSKKEKRNLSYFKKFVGKGDLGLYVGTFLYSLSPLPSNFLFISFGLSGVNLVPVMLGFCLGRLISYILLVGVSFKTFAYFSVFFNIGEAKWAADVIGVILAILIIFVDWEKVYLKTKRIKEKITGK